MMAMIEQSDKSAAPALLPCPFCGGPVALEEALPTRDYILGERRWWGVVCRNTFNLGGSCAIQQRPSASPEAATKRWNRRAAPADALAALRELVDEVHAQASKHAHLQDWDEFDRLAEKVCAAQSQPAQPEPRGEVVVTRNPAGQIVAVTRQDDDGRILSVIAEAQPEQNAELKAIHAVIMHVGGDWPDDPSDPYTLRHVKWMARQLASAAQPEQDRAALAQEVKRLADKMAQGFYVAQSGRSWYDHVPYPRAKAALHAAIDRLAGTAAPARDGGA
jgi:hypothetical protein